MLIEQTIPYPEYTAQVMFGGKMWNGSWELIEHGDKVDIAFIMMFGDDSPSIMRERAEETFKQ